MKLARKMALCLVMLVSLTSLAALASDRYMPSTNSLFQVAFAGGNGQQLDFSDGVGYVYTVAVSGYNQYGHYATNSWGTPYYDDNYIPGWYWVGYITIDEYGSSSNFLGEEWTSVPQSQSGAWWWYCDFQGGSSGNTGGSC